MKLHELRQAAPMISLLTILALISGCVVCKTDENYTGPRKADLKQVDFGETTKDQLIEMFGEPTEQAVMQDGTEILRYKCVKTKDNAFVMFPPPIVIKDDKDEVHIIAFELQGGVVQRYKKENVR